MGQIWRVVVTVLAAFPLTTAAHPGKASGAKGERVHLFRIREDGKYGFIDKSGHVVIPPQFHYAGDFSEGLATISVPGSPATPGRVVDGKWQPGKPRQPRLWGYIDRSGKVVIKPRFARAWHFSDSRALIEVRTSYKGRTIPKYGYIDRTGKIVIKPHWSVADHFSEGLAAAMKATRRGHLYGFINTQGRFVIEPRFPSFNLGSVIKRQAAPDHPDPLYNNMGAFHEGLAQVGPVTFINQRGRVVVNFHRKGTEIRGTRYTKYPHGYMKPYSEGLAAIIRDQTQGWGYVDKRGRVVIPYRFREAGPFCEGLAAVEVDGKRGQKGKYGYISRHGKLVIQPIFDYGGDFSEGLAYVSTGDGLRGYVDKTGKIPFELPAGFRPFTSHTRSQDMPFRGGLAGGPGGYVDRMGRIVWRPGMARPSSEPTPTAPADKWDRTDGAVIPWRQANDLVSSDAESLWSFSPKENWRITRGRLIFSGNPLQKGYATYLKDLQLGERFAMSMDVTCNNIKEAGFGFAGGFQMSVLSPKDGQGHRLTLVVDRNDIGFWVNGKRKGCYFGRGTRLKLGVALKPNNRPHSAVFRSIRLSVPPREGLDKPRDKKDDAKPTD